MTKSVMEVILLENVPAVGKLGDIVSVRMGYARNFLIPKGKVKRATDSNKREFEANRKELEKIERDKLLSAQKISAQMASLTIQIAQKAGVDGRLFGSVSVADIVSSLSDSGFSVDKHSVRLTHPIKAVGDYEVLIFLHPEVSFHITVSVLGET